MTYDPFAAGPFEVGVRAAETFLSGEAIANLRMLGVHAAAYPE